MVVGHYAVGLAAHKEYPELPLWVCLVTAMWLDFVMGVLLVLGIEHMTAHHPHDPKLYAMSIDMTFSHDLLPVLGWTGLAALAGYGITRTWQGAAVLAALVISHEVLDMLGGFYHYIFGPDTMRIGLGLYETTPLAALAIELLICLACVYWFLRNSNAGLLRSAGLYAVMVAGVAFMLPLSV